MTSSFLIYRRPQFVCGLLLLALTSCGNPSPSPNVGENTPNPTERSDTQSPSDLTPPGQVDPASSETDAAQPNAGSEAESSTNPSANPSKKPVAAAPNMVGTDNANNANAQNADNDGIRILSCQTTSGLVNDPNGPLNVRSAPDTSVDNVVGSLDDGAFVSIVGDRENWWQIDAPETGWVSKSLINSTCNEKLARIEFASNATSVTLSDRFFGTGYHHYQLEARAGQVLTLEATSDTSPIPFVLTAGDRDLTDGIGHTNADRWSGTLPEDGDYTIVFDSNFRGYTYAVQLTVE